MKVELLKYLSEISMTYIPTEEELIHIGFKKTNRYFILEIDCDASIYYNKEENFSFIAEN